MDLDELSKDEEITTMLLVLAARPAKIAVPTPATSSIALLPQVRMYWGCLAQSKQPSTFRGCRLDGNMDSQRYWMKCLHESGNGQALEDSSNAPGSTGWLSERHNFPEAMRGH